MDKLSPKRGRPTVAKAEQLKQSSVGITPQWETRPNRQLPEYLRVNQAVRQFSIGRSTLYSLIANGSVTSRVVKTSRHNVSGIRLISTDSLRAFIESCGQGAKTEKAQ